MDRQTTTRTPARFERASIAAFAALLFLASCSSWFSDDKKSNLDGECVGKEYVALNDLLKDPYQSCSTSGECPSGSYCESDAEVHHIDGDGSAFCYWQCYSDSDCGFGNHCDCDGQCQELDGDPGSNVDPSCPRSETLLATLETGVHYLSTGASSEWPLQETVAPLSDATGIGCSFSNMVTDGPLGTLGVEAVGLQGRLAWEAPSKAGWGGPETYLECDDSTTLDFDGTTKAFRMVFRMPADSSVDGGGMQLAGKRDGSDSIFAPFQGSGWNIKMDGPGELNVYLFDGSGIVDQWVDAPPINGGTWPGYLELGAGGGSYADGNWHFVELVVDTSGPVIQVRARTDLDPGVSKDLDPSLSASNWDLSNTGSFRIGGYADPNSLGTPDNLQVTYAAAFSGAEALAMVNLATPDDAWWTDAAATEGRACLYNENCPYGSQCNDDTKTCTFSCIDTDHPVKGCTGGTVCDCFGDCVEPGAVAVRRNDDMPFMEVMPRRIPVSSEVFQPRRVMLNLVTEVESVATASTAVPVTVLAMDSEAIEVSCDADSQSTGTYGSSCTLDSWSFDTHGLRKRAAGSFWVRSVAGSLPEKTGWVVKLTSGGTAKHVEYVHVREYDTPVQTPAIFEEAGSYTGTLERVGLGDETDNYPNDTVPLKVAVTAIVTADTIDFYNKTKVIGPTGWFRVGNNLSQSLLSIQEDGLGLSGAVGDVAGVVEIFPGDRTFHQESGLLTGQFELVSVAKTRWEFTLSQDSGFTELCDGEENPCGAGQECVAGLCRPESDWTAGPWQATPGLQSLKAQRWKDATTVLLTTFLATFLAEPTAITTAYARDTGVARADWSAISQDLFGLNMLDGLSVAVDNFGYRFSGEFVDYLLSWPLGLAFSSPMDFRIVEPAGGGTLCRVFEDDDSCSGSGFLADLLYKPDSQTPPYQPYKDLYIPCHRALNDLGAAGLFVNLVNNWPLWGDSPLRATCEELHANQLASNPDTESDYTAFLSTECQPSNYRIRFDLTDEHTIFRCPFRDALLGGMKTSLAKAGERALCYRPVNSDFESLLHSQIFGTEVAPLSGDLKCVDGSLPSGVKHMSYLDRVNDGDETMSTGEMLSTCMRELALEPPSFDGPLTAANAVGQFTTFFAERECFDPAIFYSAIAELTETIPFAPPWDPVAGWGSFTPGPEAQKLLTRLLQQWTDLHTSIVEKGTSNAEMSEALRFREDLDLGEQGAVDDSPSYEELLDTAEGGWQLLLSFQEVVANFRDPAVLVDPDYRPASLQTDSEDHDQSTGLPVLVMQGLGAHMRLVKSYLDFARKQAYGDCYSGTLGTHGAAALERSQRAIHYANLVSEVWGSTVVELLASPTPPTIPWLEEWQQAEVEFQSVRSEVVDRIGRLHACSESGADERAVPLFFGDAVGTSAKYFAASDYILSGWAVPAVQTAIAALDGARAAFISKRNSETQDLQTASDAAFRLAELKAQWGRGVLDHCGIEGMSPEDAISSVRLFDYQIPSGFQPGGGGFQLATCHIDLSKEECRPQASEPVVYDPISYPVSPVRSENPDISEYRYEFCFMSGIKDNLAFFAPRPGTADDTVHSYTFLFGMLFDPDDGGFYSIPEAVDDWENIDLALGENNGFPGVLISDDEVAAPKSLLTIARTIVANLAPASSNVLDAEAVIGQAESACAEHVLFGGSSTPDEDRDYENPRIGLEDTSHCLRGAYGAGVARRLRATTSLARAEQRLIEQEGRYLDSATYCRDQLENDLLHEDLFDAHLAHQTRLRDAIAFTSRAKGAMAAVPSVAAGEPTSVINLSMGAIELGMGAIEDEMRSKFQAAEDGWQQLTVQRETNSTYRECMFSADQIRAGMGTWKLMAREALRDYNLVEIELNNQMLATRNLVQQSRASVDREAGRYISRYSHHYWLDEAIDSYERDFDHAQDLTLMALQAVEFEFQQSIALRDEILGARTPEELQNVIIDLRQEQFSRTVNSRRPEDSQLVVSIKDQIMHLGETQDPANQVPGERYNTSTESLRDRLMAADSAVFDSYGTYLGQGLSFHVLPDGVLEHRCGERLWTMTATLQGDLLDVEAPNTSLFVIRNNSFSSQWCAGHDIDGELMQTGSRQPSGGLFRREDQGGQESFGLQQIVGLLQPWFNVPRSEFYREQYSEGSSDEFAGTGLYGEYTILFPEAGLLEDGFPLERVEDILIRFDYISVDNLTNL